MTVEIVFSDAQPKTKTYIISFYDSEGDKVTVNRRFTSHLPWDNSIFFDTSERISKSVPQDLDITKLHTITYRKSTTLGQAIYIDGELFVEDKEKKAAVGKIAGGNLASGSGAENADGYRWTGNIYSLRVYNRALSDEEIEFNYKIDQNRFGEE